MTPNNPYLRLLAGIVAVAVAIRVTYDLLRPVLPLLSIVIVVLVVARVVTWWRGGRW